VLRTKIHQHTLQPLRIPSVSYSRTETEGTQLCSASIQTQYLLNQLRHASTMAKRMQQFNDTSKSETFDVLEFVGGHPAASVSDVARGLRLQTSNVSNTVRHLVERGLLERASDPRDQRRVLLRLTELSSEHRDLLQAAWASLLAGMLPDLGDRDVELLLAAAPAFARLAERAAAGPVGTGPASGGSDAG